ncbi:membrane integrity-associated transporter subunit PqiC [Roseococcus sp. SDR]|uniref:ABC-type transport auxiliary lipoprotein family protein n=1 Tax=Roseococcus sp. SDR TaxID=2835532 RepID=UPI001BCE54DB|nr:ABC-type transport auxiliary lipoprotein family protein [Roseococcus sp. SDR]MBS7790125.1 membrane integrity-associated transporter subunit PqiC [Roseococcus sp. SDR]MBV1845439.1 membrane integrity-associated transporter subunit PqiC [Roseococcus sp. SDR]
MNRRILLGLPLLAGCSVLPDRPFIESQRFALSPRREGPPGARLRQALLVRSMRAAPGMEQRGLQRLRGAGQVEVAPYEEWLAPPAELAELALRQWLLASGRFTAVTAPGSRLATFLVLETELVALQVGPDGARASLAALLLAQAGGLGDARALGQTVVEGRSPVALEAGAAQRAAAMQAALGQAFAALESWIVSLV